VTRVTIFQTTCLILAALHRTATGAASVGGWAQQRWTAVVSMLGRAAMAVTTTLRLYGSVGECPHHLGISHRPMRSHETLHVDVFWETEVASKRRSKWATEKVHRAKEVS
jgi:hypothetical protein